MSIGESTEKSKGYFSKYESFTRSSRFKPEAYFYRPPMYLLSDANIVKAGSGAKEK